SFCLILPLPPCSTLFPYTTLFRSLIKQYFAWYVLQWSGNWRKFLVISYEACTENFKTFFLLSSDNFKKSIFLRINSKKLGITWIDRKSTRLNSSHVSISYAVFCLK